MRHTVVHRCWTCLLTLTAIAAAQTHPFTVPRIGAIEYYGIHKISLPRISKALGLKAGDPLPPSKGDIEENLEKLPDVVQARLEAVCCQPDGSASLFVGIEEKGAAHFAYRSPPAANVALPTEITEAYDKLLTAIEAAARRGSAADLTQGHALMADADAREIQQTFPAYAKDHLDLLRNVLRNAADDGQRAMAATIIGYAPIRRR